MRKSAQHRCCYRNLSIISRWILNIEQKSPTNLRNKPLNVSFNNYSDCVFGFNFRIISIPLVCSRVSFSRQIKGLSGVYFPLCVPLLAESQRSKDCCYLIPRIYIYSVCVCRILYTLCVVTHICKLYICCNCWKQNQSPRERCKQNVLNMIVLFKGFTPRSVIILISCNNGDSMFIDTYIIYYLVWVK